MKLQQKVNKLALDTKFYKRDSKFSSNQVKLHPKRATHCVCFSEKRCFDFYGCASPENIPKNLKI